MNITIGISKGSGAEKYVRYGNWISQNDSSISLVDFSRDSAEFELDGIDGLILTGGSDIDPKWYDRPDQLSVCEDIDEQRDQLEFDLLRRALDRKIPVFAICRGCQILNVHFGGTLIAHLPAEVDGGELHQKSQGKDVNHEITVQPGTLLFKATGQMSGIVNSAHHQAVGRLGEGLMASARSDDGVIEAIERREREGESYVLGVQWHPERMLDQTSPFSSGIREQFIFEVESHRALFSIH